MTNEQIARLIVDAYNMGKEDGHNDGYDKGYNAGYSDSDDDGCQKAFDNGYEKGYEAARDEFEVVVEVEEESEEECNCAMCADPVAYDMGWNDGFTGEGNLDEDMIKIPAYVAGYESGKKDRKHGV
jgi:hypothetical protein